MTLNGFKSLTLLHHVKSRFTRGKSKIQKSTKLNSDELFQRTHQQTEKKSTKEEDSRDTFHLPDQIIAVLIGQTSATLLREGGERKKRKGMKVSERTNRRGLLSSPAVALHLFSRIRPSSRTLREAVCKFNLTGDLYPPYSLFRLLILGSQHELLLPNPIRTFRGERAKSRQLIEIPLMFRFRRLTEDDEKLFKEKQP